MSRNSDWRAAGQHVDIVWASASCAELEAGSLENSDDLHAGPHAIACRPRLGRNDEGPHADWSAGLPTVVNNKASDFIWSDSLA
jgi:hypothetical protein